LAVPVVSRSGEVLGGLFFGHGQPGIFTARAERLLVGLAAQAGVAIDNSRLYQTSQREVAARKEAEEKLLDLNRKSGAAGAAARRTARLQHTQARRKRAPVSASGGRGQRLRSLYARSGRQRDQLESWRATHQGLYARGDHRPAFFQILYRRRPQQRCPDQGA
jgi:GAF domain-containing protein